MTEEDLENDFVNVPLNHEGAMGIIRLYEWANEQLPFIPMDVHRLIEKIRASMNQGCMKHHLLMARFKQLDHDYYIVVCPKCDRKVYNQLKIGEYDGSQYKMLRDFDEYKELFII